MVGGLVCGLGGGVLGGGVWGGGGGVPILISVFTAVTNLISSHESPPPCQILSQCLVSGAKTYNLSQI